MKVATQHPQWALQHKKPGTELKLINGRYYLYGVRSVYDKQIKRAKKVSLGIIGSITEEKGLIPSQKQALKAGSTKTYHEKELFTFEYGFSKWLMDSLVQDGVLQELKSHFPRLWQFIVVMVFCRIAYKSPLKNIPFYSEQSSIAELLGWREKLNDQKVSDLLFLLGTEQSAIHGFMQLKDRTRKTVLVDATDITLQSKGIALSQKGYNAKMDFQPQFVLLYLYDAQSLKPLYYRLLPGNIREISALKNTIKISGMEQCVYVADKGFFSESNVSELEKMGMQYIIPLKRDNVLIPYEKLKEIEQSNNYFEFGKRFVFHADTKKENTRSIDLFLDGKLREQEKTDYLSRIKSVPESYSKTKFNDKINKMGTLAIMHNTDIDAPGIYHEYKNRGEIEQFFDHLKNTLDASCSGMQREQSLNGWMFINHLSMQMIYRLYSILKTTPLNKKQKLNHKYSINDTVEHLKSIRKISFAPDESVIAECNKSTKTLLQKLKIDIT